MTHDHEAVYLAVASLDFELTPGRASPHGGRTRPMSPSAPRSRRAMAIWRDCSTGSRCTTPHRRSAKVMRAALVPPRDRNRWPLLLAAAALMGLTIAAAAAVGAFRERSPLDGDVVQPSASLPALGDAGVASAVELGWKPETQRQFCRGPGFGAPLDTGTIAEVVSGRLRIPGPRRASRTTRSSTNPCSTSATACWSSRDPLVASDYEWYLVSAWRPGNVFASWPVGWVSRGDHDGSPWITRPSVDPCPTGAVTMGGRRVAASAGAGRVLR